MKKALIYSFVLIAFSWTVYYGLTALWKDLFSQGGAPMMLLKSAYMLFPMLVALVLQAVGRELMTGSVFIAAVIHGNINAMAVMVVMFVIGGNDLTVGLTGLGGFLAFALVILALWLYDRRSGRNIMTSPVEC
ncbi:MAG: hypothetical protein SPF15_08575 [Candidatus Cryptobacteroides sp.]|uniref:hypothetical protein n=1 Tax=Candidatus Cryptobacteroides sp. TaxID=2952915 RepID=UPI002A80F78D|nr:hypothetical protein [Candidatus Cryptobacteroides sp.]MDY5044038.1 hypothetical protein [Candidatus Cryptobacteroides sp.]